ncbi:UNVERIFIED_CONTAM: hypothetical protein Sangu_1410400 [Sesamum angustifolium]|uniref:Uncharacterized protein n=1 Tax=Sesamum angustifolium TaxID=2727405 RepID=A0AAW2N6Z6_9LAMI
MGEEAEDLKDWTMKVSLKSGTPFLRPVTVCSEDNSMIKTLWKIRRESDSYWREKLVLRSQSRFYRHSHNRQCPHPRGPGLKESPRSHADLYAQAKLVLSLIISSPSDNFFSGAR